MRATVWLPVFVALRFGTQSAIAPPSNREFCPLKVPNEREFLSGVPNKITGDLRNVSVLACFRDQQQLTDFSSIAIDIATYFEINVDSVSANSYVRGTRK